MRRPGRKLTKKGCGKPGTGLQVLTALFAILLLASLCLAIVPSSVMAQRAGEAAPTDGIVFHDDGAEYMPGEVLIRFADDAAVEKARALLGLIAIDGFEQRIESAGEELLALLRLKAGVSVEGAVRLLEQFAGVLYAEPNYLARAAYAPSDPDYQPEQWGLNNYGQTVEGQVGTAGAHISAQDAWDIEKGWSDPVTVAVVDSGIDLGHPDLDGKIWDNGGEIPDNDIDDDGNGYVDDVCGYNWAGITQGRYYYYDYNDEKYYTTARYFGSQSDNLVRAQSLRGTGRQLTHVGFLLQKTGITTGGITVSLRSDISDPDLASFAIAPSEVSLLGGEVYKALSSPVTLTAGSTYYLVLETTNNDPTNYYYLYDNWGASTAGTDRFDPYRDGQEYRWDGSAWQSAAYVDDDLYFRTNANAVPRDDNGHGTCVGGIAGAEEGNGQGGVGVSFGAELMPLKSLDSSGGGTYANILSGVYYAADNGAEVINLSLGGSTYSQAMQDAIDYAYAEGVTVFASAGNSGTSDISYPAGMDNVIGVGATTNGDLKASFSNHNASVDLTAPGQYVYSTMPTYPVGLNSYGYTQDYDFLSGTSMSAPMAAGLAALVLSAEPLYTPAQVERWMEEYADDLGSPGRDDDFGYGRINAFATLEDMPPVPRIDGLSPAFGPEQTDVTISGSGFGPARAGSSVSFGPAQAAAYTSWSDSEIVCRVPEGVYGGVQVSVTTEGGTSNSLLFYVGLDPAMRTWYLAEGSTSGGMETFILVQNPNGVPAEVELTFITDSGPREGPSRVLPPGTRFTWKANDYVDSYNVSTVVSANHPVVAERSMYGDGRTWAHDSIGYSLWGQGFAIRISE